MKELELIGNLTKDTEVKKVKVGDAEKTVCRMSLAVNERGGDGVTYIDVECWDKLAENCSKYLSKGKKVYVSADIKNNNYEKDGVKHYGYKFIAREVEFLSPQDNTVKM